MKMTKLLPPLLLSLALPAASLAETPEEKGLAIAKEAERRDEGWGDSSATMQMILRNKRGDESVRDLRSKSLEIPDDGDKSMIIFDSPPDQEGTALLTFSHKTGPDDQWLFLPALKRVKRIASKNKSGPFVGSEFAFEDLSSQEIEKYTYKYLRDEPCEGGTCFVTERYPTDEYSGYTKQIAWTDQAEYRPWKIEFYDRKKTLLKTLTFSGYKQYLDKHWRPAKMVMVNHQTGKSTELVFSDYKFKSGLSDSDFTQNSLKRAR